MVQFQFQFRSMYCVFNLNTFGIFDAVSNVVKLIKKNLENVRN